ncbi:FAD:protein FMN transferase [Methylorubrum extorquens]|uniref:FAD:protein FMN transferase n=1 Tax=Methylorubrum extorquens TaxID=408 RepID=UPI000158FE96|nr:FAD:protein FMN transferase [Methylorubrum extorquens]ABY29734.1 ApbE family lipoprotein [Methylorubrum extorquens PA1]KQP88666.1 thiamine biosynthesis protein ApbE [Methylobacterium sp. Leaf119]WIU41055.1 FAD:protein FMN transferase [Methylorubrum extorquens]
MPVTARTPRRVLLGMAGLAALAGLGGSTAFRMLAAERGLTTRTRAGLAFGTTVALTAAGPDPAALDAALSDGFAAMRAVEAAASLFRADSALSCLNRDGRLDAPPADLTAMLGFALDLAQRTGGAFDPTVQPLWPTWAGAAARGERPDPKALQDAVARIGWRRVALTPERIDLEPGTALTLNALIQGYAADRVMAALRARGITDAFVDTGEFGAIGAHPDGTPWQLGIADPRRPEALSATITPFSGFAATSGDYAMSFSPDRADHHIFDPTTGRSPRGLASVTVTAETGLLADGLSTACMVLGPEAGGRLVAQWPGCSVRFVGKA